MTLAEFAKDYIVDGSVEDLISYLRKRYTAEPVPPCRVCGKELEVQAIGGGMRTKWACQTYVNGAIDWKHYEDSGFEQYRHGDSAVIAVLDELERLQKNECLEACCDNSHRCSGGLVNPGCDLCGGTGRGCVEPL